MSEVKIVCFMQDGIPLTELSERQKERVLLQYKSYRNKVQKGSYNKDLLVGFNYALIILGYEIFDPEFFPED